MILDMSNFLIISLCNVFTSYLFVLPNIMLFMPSQLVILYRPFLSPILCMTVMITTNDVCSVGTVILHSSFFVLSIETSVWICYVVNQVRFFFVLVLEYGFIILQFPVAHYSTLFLVSVQSISHVLAFNIANILL